MKDPSVPLVDQEIVQLVYPIDSYGEVIRVTKEKIYMVCLPKLTDVLDQDADGVPDVIDVEPGMPVTLPSEAEPLINFKIINCPPFCD